MRVICSNYVDNSEPLRPPVLVDEPKCPDTLCNLALNSLVKNKVKCDRQNVNRSLWNNFNSVSTCKECNQPRLELLHLIYVMKWAS